MKNLIQTILIILAAIIFNALLNNPITQVYTICIMFLALLSVLIWFMYELTKKSY